MGMKTQKLLELKTGMSLKNKQEWIRNAITEKINNGIYLEKLPSLRALSEEYNANVITIQKALRPLIEEGVLVSLRGSGIHIESKRHFCIGITGKPVKEYFFDEKEYGGKVFKHIFQYILEKNDYFAFQQKTAQSNYRNLFRNNSAIDGLIISAPDSSERHTLESLRLPYIVIGSTFKGSTINYVDSENEEDSERAVLNLIKKGYKRIAFIYGEKITNNAVRERLKGYRKAIKKYGLNEFCLGINTSDFNSDETKVKTLSSLSSWSPDAIFGASFRATKILLENLPKNIIKHIGLCVYDDMEKELMFLGIPYCAVIQPLDKIGKTAIAGLYKLLNDNQKCVQERFASRLEEIG